MHVDDNPLDGLALLFFLFSSYHHLVLIYRIINVIIMYQTTVPQAEDIPLAFQAPEDLVCPFFLFVTDLIDDSLLVVIFIFHL